MGSLVRSSLSLEPPSSSARHLEEDRTSTTSTMVAEYHSFVYGDFLAPNLPPLPPSFPSAIGKLQRSLSQQTGDEIAQLERSLTVTMNRISNQIREFRYSAEAHEAEAYLAQLKSSIEALRTSHLFLQRELGKMGEEVHLLERKTIKLEREMKGLERKKMRKEKKNEELEEIQRSLKAEIEGLGRIVENGYYKKEFQNVVAKVGWGLLAGWIVFLLALGVSIAWG